MSQFEEMESVLEEERRALEAQLMALAGERANMRRTLDGVRAELAKNALATGAGAVPQSGGTVAAALVQGAQAQKVNEVPAGTALEGDAGPVPDGSFQQIG